MTARLDVTPKPTEQNRIVRTGKFEVVVTNNEQEAQLVLGIWLVYSWYFWEFF